MADQVNSEIVRNNPIGAGLDSFRALFNSTCNNGGVACSLDALGQLNQENLRTLLVVLLSLLLALPAARLLRSSRGKPLLSELAVAAINANDSDNFDFDFDRFKPLLNAALAAKPDHEIWDQVYKTLAGSTPPPRPIASSLQQTPWLRNTSSFVNSSEHRKYVDGVLKEELGSVYVGLRNFYATYFGDLTGLETASRMVFDKCTEGSNPLFSSEGWNGWPTDAKEENVLRWFTSISERLATFGKDHNQTATRQRPLAQSNKPIQGSTAERKIDVGFVGSDEVIRNGKCRWSQILIPGELKSNPSADTAPKGWLDIGRYVRELLSIQDNRRFAIAFTLCGPFMRLWVFDRLGGIASDRFNINEDGFRFVYTILGFSWMNEAQLGFDPTIITSGGKRFIEISRNGCRERLVIDALIRRAPCITGRATTCWKAYSENNPNIPLVIKDSWQCTEREEEGELLQGATNRKVVHVGQYYHHYTVQVHGSDDDVQSNVRGGLDITMAENYHPQSVTAPRSGVPTVGSWEGGSTTPYQKRPASQMDAPLPPSKRTCLASPAKIDQNTLPNRIHRRLIIQDYGQPIYKASSRTALLSGLVGCITGHESLHRAGILHRDISIHNLIINEDNSSPSPASFLIDLDLAVREQRESASEVKRKTGTRAFMAIGVLLGEQHSFMHDLESFFWVLFWICIHDNGPHEKKRLGKVLPEFDQWNYVETNVLADLKKGCVSHEADFIKASTKEFAPYYQPMVPWVNRLRKVVFPNGGRWEGDDEKLYAQMKEILRRAQEDPEIAA
ncbi:hypothetical protein O1611_g1727 [Lasiodiplodia mahajangana]|uniref:Uncharacterized protein n=1 Tax=Lasiodiplodia mahajangana TaxID=1108764 RepID=A0ACC2JWK2_9PEZI|nr:hypothetical protein O1611_g1727 [Lasiodiplodia mahajangana]